MGIEHLFSTPVVIQDQAFVDDEFGMRRLGAWATTATVLGWFDSNLRRSGEQIDNRDQAESDGLLFLPAGTPLSATSRVVINGLTYQIFGIPAPIPVPGGIHHIEVRIKRYTG